MISELLLAAGMAVALVACGASSPGGDRLPDAQPELPADVAVDGQALEADDSVADFPAETSPDVPDPDAPPNPFGLPVRIPVVVPVPSTGAGGVEETILVPQQDHVCTFVTGEGYGGYDGLFYVQATPLDCTGMMGCTYRTDGAWMLLDGFLREVPWAAYDGGGNHQNDSVEFRWGDWTFRYYHSTFGIGWRKCQPMDCLEVYDLDGTSLVEDGCTPERTLPVACVAVASDGSISGFLAEFHKCPGDWS